MTQTTRPVTVTIGEDTAEIGTVTLDPAEAVAPQIAELLRAAADAIEHDEEDDEDGEG